MWPGTWWNQFNYTSSGIDPYTEDPYPNMFNTEQGSIFVDWPLWVETFGEDQCYWSTFLGLYKDNAVNKWKAANHQWSGSCYGFAGSSFLGFNYRDEFIKRTRDYQILQIFPPCSYLAFPVLR